MPTWPLKDAHGKVIADREILAAEVEPWRDLAKHGIPIHFGETGCNRYTPPKVYYAWLSDMLDVINSLHCGWAFWNFRGVAGPLDPDRPGTEYKNWYGHKLDFNMLRIIQSKLKV
jgi:endoglucanase